MGQLAAGSVQPGATAVTELDPGVCSVRITSVFFLTLLVAPTYSGAQSPDWMLGPFVKPSQVNPVISPSAGASFLSPMTDSVVRWEELATFNPAAVVKDGKVYVLYRAEDASGKTEIGFHTSRIGLAESVDGLRFTRRAAPVLFPDKDAQARYEWTGGVEDPRCPRSFRFAAAFRCPACPPQTVADSCEQRGPRIRDHPGSSPSLAR